MAEPNLSPEAQKLISKTPAIDFDAPLDLSILKNRSVLITGGAVGLGFATAETIASHGAIVTLADIQEEAGKAAAENLSSKGYKVGFVYCDVTSYESQYQAFKFAIEFGGGKLDVVIPNAGVIAQKNLFDMAATTEPSLENPPPEPGFSGVDINLKGVYYSCYLALHYFRLPVPADATPFKKAIVLIASLAGYVGYPYSTTYSISKFGVRGLFYGIREKGLRESPQVRVNLVAPWYIKTPMVESLDPVSAANIQLLGFVPIEEVVDAIVRLSADEGLSGRSAGVFPEARVDLGDDIWDGYGGRVTGEHVAIRMSKFAETLARMKK